MMEEVKGTVERVNPKGVKVDGRWYNYSKYMDEEIPELNEGDEVRMDVKGDWVMKFKLLSRQPFEAGNKKVTLPSEKENKEVNRQVVITRLACLNTAVEVLRSHARPVTSKSLFKIAEELESWVWRNSREESGEDTLKVFENETLTGTFEFGEEDKERLVR